MKALTFPLPDNTDDEIINIELSFEKSKKTYKYRLESFLWEVEDELHYIKDSTSISLSRITRLKKSIENYDNAWELVQIFAPLENSDKIRVLYKGI